MTARSAPASLGAACADLRLATESDAVGGRQPRFVARPASTAEASAVLRAAAAGGLAVLPRGAGTRLHWGAPPRACDLVVDTGRMNQVIEHAAGDLVVSVQAGVSTGQLAGVLAGAGQRLALDPPPGGAAGPGTVGGLIATGVAGPLRLRYGTPRDLLIGLTFVRADGAVAHSGGKVVKNVAGYDIGKLLAGSYGTLGLMTEAVFRLHPRPPAAAYLTLRCPDPAAAQRVIRAAAGSPLAPAAAELDWPGRDAPISAAILLEGDPQGVAERAARLSELLGGAAPGPGAPPWWGRGPAAAAAGTVIRITFWAGTLAAVLDAIARAGATAGLDPAVGGSAAAGVLHAALPEGAPAAAVAAFLASLRAGIAGPAGPAAGLLPVHASAVVLHAPAAVRDAVDIWGPVPALGLMRAVKDQFDPGHRMAPGRFVGGI